MGRYVRDAVNGKWAANVYVRREGGLSVRSGVSSVADGGTISHGMIDYTSGESAGAIAPKTSQSAGNSGR